MGISSFKELKVWQKGMDNAAEVYRLTKSFPQHEMYGLVSQMRRAAVSIPSNIAEGHARKSTREYLQFISIARGSVAELETQLLLSIRFGYLAENDVQTATKHCEEIGKMLHVLQGSLHKRLKSLSPKPQSLSSSP